jgi:hypothetical protein
MIKILVIFIIAMMPFSVMVTDQEKKTRVIFGFDCIFVFEAGEPIVVEKCEITELTPIRGLK